MRTMFEYVEHNRFRAAGTAAAGQTAAKPAAAAAAEQQQSPQQASLTQPRSRKIMLSVGVAQVSLLWLVSAAALPAPFGC